MLASFRVPTSSVIVAGNNRWGRLALYHSAACAGASSGRRPLPRSAPCPHAEPTEDRPYDPPGCAGAGALTDTESDAACLAHRMPQAVTRAASQYGVIQPRQHHRSLPVGIVGAVAPSGRGDRCARLLLPLRARLANTGASGATASFDGTRGGNEDVDVVSIGAPWWIHARILLAAYALTQLRKPYANRAIFGDPARGETA